MARIGRTGMRVFLKVETVNKRPKKGNDEMYKSKWDGFSELI